jgi:hypothetical protein
MSNHVNELISRLGVIKTIHRVTYTLGGKERVVLETEDMQEAKKKDAQMDMALSLLVETERLVKDGKVTLPKGVSFQSLESTLEDLFVEFAANQEGMKRAMKGAPYALTAPTEPKQERRKPAARKQT